MYRKLWLIALSVLFMLPCRTLADDNLYPFRENGKWGYISASGKTVIPPEWEGAAPFSGGAAAVTDAEHQIRLIDPQGRVLSNEAYDARYIETPFSYLLLTYSDDGREQWGWYDKQSGHVEKCRYTVLRDCGTDCGLILAQWEDEDGAGGAAFLRRSTGEIAIPVEPDGEIMSDEGFREGYAYLSIESGEGWQQYLIDENGRKTVFPEGIWPCSAVHDGVLAITEAGGGCGIAKPDGTVVCLPDEVYIDPFSDGRAFFCPKGREYDTLGILDTEGRVITAPQWTLDAGWPGADSVGFHNGYAVLLTLTDKKTDHDVFVILDRDGRVVYTAKRHPGEGTSLLLADRVMENGLIWYRLTSENGSGYGLLRIRDGRAEDLTGPKFEAIGGVSEDLSGLYGGGFRFSQGLYPIMLDGKWGYIGMSGETVIPPEWDSASFFRDGLALVTEGGKLRYIDSEGNTVRQEE